MPRRRRIGLRRALGRILRKPYYGFWDCVESSLYRGREYTLAVPSGRLVYAPWFDDSNAEFGPLLREVRQGGPLTVTPDRCYELSEFCRHALGVPGDVAECGTFSGGTAQLLALVMRRHFNGGVPDRRLHLFDTFTGMPDFVVPARDHHLPGDFGETSLEFVQRRLRSFDYVVFHAGVIPNTFDEVTAVPSYSFVHLDVDIYPTMLECCEWFWPRLSPGGVIVFDDYGYRAYRHAARAAIDEFFQERGAKPIALPTGQAVAIKHPA